MDSAIAALIASAAGTGAPTSPNSRYYTSSVEQITLPDGTQVAYLYRRIVPPASAYPSTVTYTVADGDRIDNLAQRFLGDPALYWMICDANSVSDPDALTSQTGRSIQIPLPSSASTGVYGG